MVGFVLIKQGNDIRYGAQTMLSCGFNHTNMLCEKNKWILKLVILWPIWCRIFFHGSKNECVIKTIDSNEKRKKKRQWNKLNNLKWWHSFWGRHQFLFFFWIHIHFIEKKKNVCLKAKKKNVMPTRIFIWLIEKLCKQNCMILNIESIMHRIMVFESKSKWKCYPIRYGQSNLNYERCCFHWAHAFTIITLIWLMPVDPWILFIYFKWAQCFFFFSPFRKGFCHQNSHYVQISICFVIFNVVENS